MTIPAAVRSWTAAGRGLIMAQGATMHVSKSSTHRTAALLTLTSLGALIALAGCQHSPAVSQVSAPPPGTPGTAAGSGASLYHQSHETPNHLREM